MEVKEALTDEEILDTWATVLELRPHLKYEEYLSRVRKQQEEGFHLMYIRDPEDNLVKSILGYRTLHMLFSGKTLYVDDVATLAAGRGKGFGGALLDWVKDYAKDNGYEKLSLDSGYHRNNAHRLYLNKGLNLSSHHLSMLIDGNGEK